MSTKTYDPTQVKVTVGTNLIGFEKVTCGFEDKKWKLFAGVQGEAVRSKSANRLGTIVVGILQTSTDNDLMSMAEAAELLLPIMVKDFNSSTCIHMMAEGTIIDQPKKTYNAEGKEVLEWEIMGVMSSFTGGNS